MSIWGHSPFSFFCVQYYLVSGSGLGPELVGIASFTYLEVQSSKEPKFSRMEGFSCILVGCASRGQVELGCVGYFDLRHFFEVPLECKVTNC